MTVREAKKNNCILVDRNGKPLTEDELKFLEVIELLQEEYGSGVVLAIKTIMEAIVKKGKQD